MSSNPKPPTTPPSSVSENQELLNKLFLTIDPTTKRTGSILINRFLGYPTKQIEWNNMKRVIDLYLSNNASLENPVPDLECIVSLPNYCCI